MRSHAGGLNGVAIEVGTERQVAPLVVEYVVLRRVEPIGTRHLCPLSAQYPPVTVLHLIAVCDGADGVLAALDDRRLQRPQLSVLRLHQQVLRTLGAVLTVVAECYVECLSPLGYVWYCELQFHCLPLLFSAKIQKNYELRMTNYKIFRNFASIFIKKV